MEEGWFYEGAGIYRDVWLNVMPPLHVAPWGTFVSAKVYGDQAIVTARVKMENEGVKAAPFNIRQTLFDARGNKVAGGMLNKLSLRPGESKDYSTELELRKPDLWNTDSPHLYMLVTGVYSGDSLVDYYETKFGIRTIRFDPDSGFFLNGRHVELRGTNDHQDFAGIGVAVPDPLQVFRVKQLKAMGSNAVRCAHNPPAPAFLDVCDSLGMLVIDENRPMGTSPEQLYQLKQMIVRDRNHPSIILWSLGNEEWAIEGNVKGERIASAMQEFAQRVDRTRPMTAACSGGWGHGISRVIQIMGYNYIFNGDIDAHHVEFPAQPSLGTEETTSRGTRGTYATDPVKGQLMQIDREPGVKGIEYGMKIHSERPFLSGLFFWTGFDYRGEPNPFGWPQVSSQYGIFDLCGFPKDMFYYLKSQWTSNPVLHLLPHWNWAGKEGENIDVWAYRNCDSVELFLNGKKLGRKFVQPCSHAEWNVKYEAGTLVAERFNGGKKVVKDSALTTGKPAKLILVPDQAHITADGEDVAVVTVRVEDMEGRTVPTADNMIHFAIKGPGKIIGVGNGDPASHEPERFIESVTVAAILDLKMKRADPAGNPQEVSPECDDSGWKTAFASGDREGRAPQDSSERVVIRGKFNLRALKPRTRVTLLTKSIEEVQDIYVNGHLIAKGVKRDAAGQEYLLDKSLVNEGENVFAVSGPPLVRRDKWETLNMDSGLVQVVEPAGEWNRSAFNGVARVIVQSGHVAGEIELTAMSPGLEYGTLKIESKPAHVGRKMQP